MPRTHSARAKKTTRTRGKGKHMSNNAAQAEHFGEVQISWQAQHFRKVRCEFSWQVQNFCTVMSRFRGRGR